MRMRVELNRAGIGRLLTTGGIPAMTSRAAHDIARRVILPQDGTDASVEVNEYTTDRGAAMVVVTHPRAIGLEGKYGLLTNAARAIGADVRARGR